MNLLKGQLMQMLRLLLPSGLTSLLILLSTIFGFAGQVHAAAVCNAPGAIVGLPLNSYYPGEGTASAGSRNVSVGTVLTSDGLTSGGESIVAGDTLFIIQMQGADIDNSDSSSYGDGVTGGGQGYTDLESAGLYEFATVESVSGSTLTLIDPLNHSYESAGATASSTRKTFQVIKVPRFYNYTLANSGTVTPWNGRTGGVYILDVVNRLTIDGSTIDASEAGFRGAGANTIDPYTSGSNVVNYAVDDNVTNILAATKGEGIAGTPLLVNGGVLTGGFTSQSSNLTTASQGFAGGDDGYPNELDRGRGAPANAGGGGNEHNAGGAGGSNYGSGGGGGASFAFYQTNPTTPRTDCVEYTPESTAGANDGFYACGGDGSRPVGGVPGEVLTKSSIGDYEARLFMGGGGGAGSTNNAADNTGIAQSSGGNGGGIVVIRTNELVQGAGSLNLISNGGVGQQAGRDGAGAGGAGGSVLILADSGSYNFVNVTAVGGAGGDTGGTDADLIGGLLDGETQGPGGGGGGGVALVATSVTVGTVNTSGGIGGVNIADDDVIPLVFNPIQAESGDGSLVQVPYDPLVIDAAGACGEDFGDAAGYADANHVLIRQIFMGILPDGEDATLSDDNSFDAIDEDGLLTLPSLNDSATTYSVDVQVTNETGIAGTLYGWIDLDGNGTFDNDEAATTVAVPDGDVGTTQTLTWTSLPGITSGSTQMRLRITTDSSITSTTPDGFAEDGEAEDYPISILASGGVCTYPTADMVLSMNGSVVDTSASTPAHNPTAASLTYSSSTYVSAPSAPFFDGSDQFQLNDVGTTDFFNEEFNTASVAMWIKPESFTGEQVIMDEGGTTQGIALRLNGTDIQGVAQDQQSIFQVSSAFPQDNRWHHIGLVYDADGGDVTPGASIVRLFVDGIEVDTNEWTTPAAPLNTHGDTGGIGGSFNGNAFDSNGILYTGYIDEIVYWNDAATSGTSPAGVSGEANQSANMAAIMACHTPVIREDYGDAPDTGSGSSTGNYETLDANDGPRHMLGADLYIGDVAADDDADADQNATATGDDSNDGSLIGNDEGEEQLLSTATTLAPVITTDTSYQFDIDVNNGAAAAANLYAWIDFDRNGVFEDDELTTAGVISVPNTGSGTASLAWTGLSGLTAGDTFMRLRITTDTLTNTGGAGAEDTRSLGYASDGEVEDYQISIVPPPDFGDALTAYGDAWHDLSGANTIYLGLIAGDGESSTLDGGDGGVGADGDDAATDDEDGLDSGIPDLNIAATSYTLPVDVINTGAAGRLVAWLDFDGSDSFEDDEFATVAVNSSGTVNLVWNNIGSTGPNIAVGDTYIRLRITRDTTIANTTAATSSDIGQASDGEVEDHLITILGSDYGDAPASYGNASHQIASSPQLYLGTDAPDQEATTQLDTDAGLNADGDDGDGFDDENGVTVFAGFNDASTGTYDVDVDVVNTGASANLRGWIDFDVDNVFESSEASNSVVVTSSGTYTLTFTVPGGLSPNLSYARFRVSTDTIADTDHDTALSDGEVEDYPFTIADSASYFVDAECGVLGNDWSLVNDPAVSSATYMETLTNFGEGGSRPGGEPLSELARYDFNLPATGSFDVYALVNFPNTAGNSFWVSPDDTTWTLFNNGGFHTSSIWDWRLVASNFFSGTVGDAESLFVAIGEDDSLIDKFAIVTNGSPAPTGLGESTASCFDFGDAPDSSVGNGVADYSTLLLRNGPYHADDGQNDLFIGSVAPDTEPEALANLSASGDALDELPTDLSTAGLALVSVGATAYSVDVDTTNNTGTSAELFAWLDSDRDGVFEDSELATGAPFTITTGGTATTAVSWSGLTALTQDNYYLRFRLTTDASFAATNGGEDERSLDPVIDGEVEDYLIYPIATDYGDVPIAVAGNFDDTNSDGTVTGADNAATHIIDPNLYLGAAAPDNDTGMWNDGADAGNDATDDDTEGATPDDEESTTFSTFAESEVTYAVTTAVENSTGSTANLYAWLDFDGNGSFDEDERATVSGGVSSGGQIPTGASGNVTLTWTVPDDTSPTTSYARLRLTTDNLDLAANGSATDDASLGAANDGEVEDYQVVISQARDFGDTPAALGDASHVVSSLVYLGATAADSDPNTQQGGDAGVGADGDDGDGTDDEDGITSFNSLSALDTVYSTTLTVENGLATAANVYAWIDFDGNNNFDEDERATLTDGTVTGTGANTVPAGASGTVILNWAALPGLSPGITYARVRITSDVIDNSTEVDALDDAATGLAHDGEVEDYELLITSGPDFGDAPIAYGAASNIVSSTLTLGADSDAEVSTQLGGDAGAGADGDDTDGNDDEEGITTLGALTDVSANYQLTLTVNNTTGGAANLYAWIDFDGSNTFDEDERAVIQDDTVTGTTATTIPDVASGTVILNWASLPGIVQGTTYVRVRTTTDVIDNTADGSAQDDASIGSGTGVGEVEDYEITITSAPDFGDAPIAYGAASHALANSLNLGVLIDSETATQLGGDAGAGADGDDGDGSDDDDAIASFDPLNNGNTSYQATLTVNNGSGSVANVYAWIDFDGNNTFDEDERATLTDGTVTGTGTNTIPVAATGTVILNWASTPGITDGTTYVRVRTTTDTIDNTADGAAQDDASVGAATDGEVEDYELIIVDASEVFFEAECAVIGNMWTVTSDPAVSNNTYVEPTAGRTGNIPVIPPPDPEVIRYQITVPLADTYDLYALLSATGTGGDSFYYSWDNVTWTTLNGWGNTGGFVWEDLSGRAFGGTTYLTRTTASANEVIDLYVSYREAGNLIDKFALIPTSVATAPTGLGDTVSSCFDFGDAPDTALNNNGTGDYSTLIGNTTPGPHNIAPFNIEVYLGDVQPDIENDALQTSNANGDDSLDEGEAQLISTAGGDAFPVLTSASTSYSIEIDVTNSKAVDAELQAWIDFDRNGTFDEDERSSATIAGVGSTQQTLTWTGLSGLTSGDVYARFRISTDPNFTTGGGAATEDAQSLDVVIDGETEDHLLTIVDIDYGDAPVDSAGFYDDTDGSGTVDASDDPASHLIADNVGFGGLPDNDSGVWGDGTDTTSGAIGRATDDDTEGATPDDEDGVMIAALSTIDTSYSLTVNVNNGDATNPARVLAWIDFDGSGSFDEDERATLSAGTVTPTGLTIPASASGTVVLNWASLPGLSDGAKYLRMRISSDTSWSEGSSGGSTEDTASTGLATNGEVEDHEIIVSGVDFGDAPVLANGYYDDTDNDGDVDISDNPARHLVVAGIRLGANDPDGEANTFGDGTDDNTNATDDDTEGATPDDEDAFSSFASLLTTDSSYSLTVTATNGDTNTATIAAWIDFDANGAFDEDERATTTVAASSTASPTLTWATIPSDIVAGTTYLRIRLSSDGGFTPSGSAATEDSASLGLLSNGEVEDYQFTVSGVDYGDAPIVTAGGFDDTDGSGTVNAADQPALHGITTNLRLGNNVADADDERYGDGIDDNGDATDDDTINDPSGGFDDENGVVSLLPIATAATTYSLDFTVTNSTGSDAFLVAWIDFDQDGLWEESERASATVTTGTSNGTETLSWAGLPSLSTGNVYLRVRISTQDLDAAAQGANVQDDAATGSAPDGEVEDYQLSIVPSEDYGDVPIATAGDYDDGNAARHGIDANVYIGVNPPDIDSDRFADGTDANGNASDDDTEGTTPDDEDGVTVTDILTSSIGSNYILNLDTFNGGGTDANVYAWIDFDGSKTFDEDEIATAVALAGSNASTANLSWVVPADTVAGTTYLRIRITTDTLTAVGGGEDERSEGLASDGEVEDFEVEVVATDFGDAPDTYGTLSTSSGAVHLIDSDVYLGNTVPDSDSNGFVDGVDDSAGLAEDDEVGGDEGIAQLLNSGTSFPELSDTDTSYSIVVNAFNNSGSTGQIYAWIDFDGSGTFDEDEFTSVGVASSVSMQVKTVNWTSLPGISSGATYMRLRMSTDSITASGSGTDERAVGQLDDGEVEDYVITVGNLDFGDAPSPYKTLLADDGPRHLIDGTLFLGNVVPDLDTDGYTDGTDNNNNATDDEATGSDEAPADLATFANLFTQNSSYTLNATYNNTTGSAARIYAWIDFDQSGTFDVDEAVEGLFGTGTSQVAALTWSGIPNDIVSGDTYLRIRITSSVLTAPASGEDTRSYGVLPNGEVEDHQINIIPVDFGDAPSSYGTFLANSGPRHEVDANLFLGTVAPDGDSNGFANGVVDTGSALDDDTEGTGDEGVTQLLGVASFPVLNDTDNTYSVTVNLTNSTAADAYLYAWIDLDNNGTFDGDEVASATVSSVGATTATLNWTGIAADSVVSSTYARFRLRSDVNASPLGSATAGEVEDYSFDISGLTSISGIVFEDINYGGGNGRNYTVSNSSYTATNVDTGATVELWSYNGSTCDSLLATDTPADGNYSFTGVAAPGDYCVRVLTGTVESNRTGYTGSEIPVQTYRVESTDGIGSLTVVADEIGGRFPALVDTGVGVFSDSQTHSWSRVYTTGATVNNVDFGYSFHTVVNTNDSGQGSLRQFIENANALSNAAVAQQTQTSLIDVSIFEIPTSDANYDLAGEEVFRITPLSPLPTVTDPAELNASTQDGAVCPAPKVEVTGTSTAGSGFNITAGGSAVRAFVINNWSVAGISLSGADGNQIDCNYIGTDSAGMVASANAVGVIVNSNQNTIGGTNSARPNVISGNTGVGIDITADQNLVYRNLVGLAADGLSRLENNSHGILIDGVNNEVGTTSSTARNSIAYNNGDAIRVIGGATSVQNEIRINEIYNNAGLAIDLTGDGITANDANDPDTGANNLLNRPYNMGVTVAGNDLQISRDIDVPVGVYTLEYYANPVCNTDQNGVAQVATPAGESFQFIGSTSVIVSSIGVSSGVDTLSSIVPTLLGGSITAKLVEDGGDTSEFSDCVTAIAPQVISGTVFEDVNYGGGSGRNLATSSGVGVPATVELWTSDGTNCTGGAPIQAITSSAVDGSYSFTTAQPGAEYCVRVVNSTVQSSRTGWVSGILPVQTYRTDFDADGAGFTAVLDHVGGESPRDADSVAGTIDIGANDGVRTQSIAMVDLAATGDVSNIDFGYNFSTIVNVNNSGQGSLAQFVQNANTLGGQASLAQSGSRVPLAGSGTEALPSGVETSIFMISNGGATAGLTSDYPNLLSGAGIAEITVDSTFVIDTDNISLDATTQSNNVFGNNGIFFNGSNTVGRNATSQNPTMQLEVELSGAGIEFDANNLQLRGFAMLPDTTALTVTSGTSAVIEHNVFGATGLTFAEPGSGSTNDLVIINGPDGGLLRQNHFGFGDQSGLYYGSGSTGWTIDDNIFQGFTQSGIETVGEFNCASADRNQFTLNGVGLDLQGGINSSNCDFVDSTFNQNLAEGILVDLDASANITIQDSVVTENQTDGIAVIGSSDEILITQNHIFNNGDLGIDLESDSVTANDGTDGDSGANELMNYPVISSVTANGTTATINGTLTSNQSTPLNVELYSSTVCNGDTAGVAQTPVFGEGENYHSTTVVTSGAAFNINVNTGDLAGPFISLIARDNDGNTSEFSACVNSTFDDYGDAPNSYGTTNASNGARHRTTASLYLGSGVPDAEIDGFVDGIDNSATASDDDTDDGNDDEDIAATVPTLTSALKNYTITVNNYSNTTGSDAELTAWIDFDRNGTFDTDEAASVTITSGLSGAVLLEWVETPTGGQGSIPLDIAEGDTFIRYRITTEAAVLTGDPSTSSPVGAAQDGEVEDHEITIDPGVDYGDAPDTYSTLIASGGPSHTRNLQLYLGSIAPDGEFDGIPAVAGAEADGDDLNGVNDDEDSADIPGITPSSTTYDISVDIINTTGDDVTVHGWFDWNRDGDFDTAEYTSTSLTGSTGSTTNVALNWTGISLGAVTGAEQTYIRIRLARTSEGITSSDFGGFFGDGEVEDYRITVSQLTCNTLYTQNFETPINGGDGVDTHIYDPSAGIGVDNLTDVFTTSVESNGVALDPITRRFYYYDDEGDNSIYFDDGSGEIDTGVNISPVDTYNRAAFNPDGELFFVDSTLTAAANGIKGFTINGNSLNTITFTDNTIANDATNIPRGGVDVTTTVGGDIAFDLDGNMYLLSYDDTNATEFYVFRITDLLTDPTAYWLRTVAVPAFSGSTAAQTAGAAFALDDSLYLFAVGGFVFSWDLGANNIVQVEDMRQGGNSFGSPDAASCIFPLLRPSLIVEKEVFNVTTPASAGFVPGEQLRYRITVENVGAFFSDSTTFTDTIPTNATYVTGSTTLNGVSVPDSGSQMPYVTGGDINSPSGTVGVIESGETAVIEFVVASDVATGYTEVCNETGIVSFTDVASISTTSGATVEQGTDNPSTTATPVYPAVGGVTSDPTCIDKISGFAITGTVFDDINVDGIDDGSGAGENGIAGVEVVLRNDTAGTCTSTQTDANGDYSFGPVTGGSYTIYESDGELTPVPSNCPAIENDPSGYVSTTVNSQTVNVTNADINDIDFGDVREPIYSPNNSGIVQPGNSLVYAHVFSPRADGTVSFGFTETLLPLIAGWSVTLYLDNDCDSMLSGADSLITGSVSATANVDICMLARVTAPSSASAGNKHTLDITADFDYAGSFVPNTSLQVTDTTTVVSADDGSLLLIKTVENITATSPYYDNGIQQVSNEGEPGDELLYRVTFQNVGSTPVTNVDIYDTTPAFTAVSVAIPTNCVDARETAVSPQIPAGLTCTLISPAAVDNVIGFTGSIHWQLTGTLAAGEEGVVLFSVTID